MNLKTYYKLLISNKELSELDNEFYFDYQGDGYNKIEFSEINPLKNAEDFKILISHDAKNNAVAFYTFVKANVLYKAMDVLLKKDGKITDHYLTISEVKDEKEITITNGVNKKLSSVPTKQFLKTFWDGEVVEYADDYLEKSVIYEEISYENVIEVIYFNNYIFMLCDAKIAGIYGTICDVYVVENNSFKEHFNTFTVDLIQPEPVELRC